SSLSLSLSLTWVPPTSMIRIRIGVSLLDLASRPGDSTPSPDPSEGRDWLRPHRKVGAGSGCYFFCSPWFEDPEEGGGAPRMGSSLEDMVCCGEGVAAGTNWLRHLTQRKLLPRRPSLSL